MPQGVKGDKVIFLNVGLLDITCPANWHPDRVQEATRRVEFILKLWRKKLREELEKIDSEIKLIT
jgi:hypothetical protein